MKYGIHLFATEASIQPGEFAAAVETRGFDSAWFSEHTHIPLGFLQSPREKRTLPEYYWQTYDPFIASGLAAAATTSLKIGTGVSLILQHDPISLAKSVATLDQVSSGRFLFGVGVGWLAEEMENHGIRYQTRYRQAGEQLAAMKLIWTEPEPEFQGNFIRFTKMKTYPKPLQSPHPPIIAGSGIGVKSMEFIIEHCDGWMPIVGNTSWQQIKDSLPELKRQAHQFGRDPDTIDLSVFCWSAPDKFTIDDMGKQGFNRIVISLEAKSRDTALRDLDEYTKLND